MRLVLFEEETKEARKEGFQEGFRKGLQTGRQEAFIKVAEKMLRSGHDIADVCEFTTLEREQVEAIDRSLDDN